MLGLGNALPDALISLERDASTRHVAFAHLNLFLHEGNFVVFHRHFHPFHILDVDGLVEADHSLLHDAGFVAT